jgi:hypothetical protein
MLDRVVIKEFLKEELEGVKIPSDICIDNLVETFCKYTEDDYYDWLKDNFNSFFDDGSPDWNLIREKIERYQKE